MRINKLNLTSENLYLVDQFFKFQFKNHQRYGEMGHFYWKLLKNKIKYNLLIVVLKKEILLQQYQLRLRHYYISQKYFQSQS